MQSNNDNLEMLMKKFPEIDWGNDSVKIHGIKALQDTVDSYYLEPIVILDKDSNIVAHIYGLHIESIELAEGYQIEEAKTDETST